MKKIIIILCVLILVTSFNDKDAPIIEPLRYKPDTEEVVKKKIEAVFSDKLNKLNYLNNALRENKVNLEFYKQVVETLKNDKKD